MGTSAVIARSLGPDGRGLLTAAMLWPGIILTAGGLVNTQTTVFFWTGQKDKGKYASVLGAGLVLALVLSAVLLPGSWVLNALALGKDPVVVQLSNLYALSLPISLVSAVVVPVFLSEEDYSNFWLLRISHPVIYLVVLLLLLGAGLLTVKAVILTVNVAMLVQLALAVTMFTKRFSLRCSLDLDLVKHYVRYGFVTNMSGFAAFLNIKLDQILMSVFLAPDVLGYYSISVAWSSMLPLIGGGISSVMLSKSAAVGSIDSGLVHNLISKLRQTNAVMIALGLLLSLVTPLGILILFGPTYSPAILPAMILTLSGTVLCMTKTLQEMLRGLGKPGLGLKSELFGLALNIPLLWLVLPTWHGIGAAFASLVSYGCVFLGLLLFIRKQFGVSISQCLVPVRGDLQLLRAGLLKPVMTKLFPRRG